MDGIRNEPAKKRDLSGFAGAMTAIAAGSGKLKSRYPPCSLKSRIQVATRQCCPKGLRKK
jgi:hypothetical protein